MKEIKFRVWDKNTKKMYDVRCIDFLHKAVDAIDGNGCVLMKFEDVEIMQSTGLKDKNGKEIFEGDIIQDDDDERFRYVVEYVSSSFMLKGKNGRYEMSELFPSDAVIGNIYENPELIS